MPPEENKQNIESEIVDTEPVIETENSKNNIGVKESEKPEVAESVSNPEIIEKPIEDNDIKPISVENPSESTQEIPTAQPVEPLEMEEKDESKPTENAENQIEPEPEIIETEPPKNIETETKEVKPEPQIKETSQNNTVIFNSRRKARELLVKARNAIQSRKRKKLDKIIVLFLKHSKITNDEVEKFLHVSDATATRYLSQLEKEGKIKQEGKTGKGVFYTKIQ